MTLSQNGINYICQNFGNTNLCCINTGLSWFYTRSGVDYNETGGTAQIVSRLASGLIDSLTMTNPARGTFTQAELNTANGSNVTLEDAQTITLHDEPTEDQWCYSAPPICADYTNQNDCENAGCYWWNGSCHDGQPTCGQINNEGDCLYYGCYWYNGSCHSDPYDPVCSDYTNQNDCENAGCYWWNGSCHSTAPSCTELVNQTDCLAYGCYWWSNNTCNSSPEGGGDEWWKDWRIIAPIVIATGAAVVALVAWKKK